MRWSVIVWSWDPDSILKEAALPLEELEAGLKKIYYSKKYLEMERVLIPVTVLSASLQVI
jgi:hypothetical protein